MINRWRRWMLPVMVGFVIAGTRTVYFAGDTDVFDGMRNLGRIDLALLPVAGWGPRLPPGHHLTDDTNDVSLPSSDTTGGNTCTRIPNT